MIIKTFCCIFNFYKLTKLVIYHRKIVENNGCEIIWVYKIIFGELIVKSGQIMKKNLRNILSLRNGI